MVTAGLWCLPRCRYEDWTQLASASSADVGEKAGIQSCLAPGRQCEAGAPTCPLGLDIVRPSFASCQVHYT